jgi:hypothetical protein
MSFSFIGALMALVPAAKRALIGEDKWEERLSRDRLLKHVALLNRSRAELIEHIEIMQKSLDDERRVTHLWREETRRLEAEVRRLNQSAHRCQHQAQLNQAMAQQNRAIEQQNQMMAQFQGLAQTQNVGLLGALGLQQAAQAQAQANPCLRSIEDCGMHHAEIVNRLNAQR